MPLSKTFFKNDWCCGGLLKVDGMMMVQSFPFKEMFLIKFSSFGLVLIIMLKFSKKTLTL